MATHSETLEQTALWQTYAARFSPLGDRAHWVQKVYHAAAEYLADVRRVFENYTLHDQTHILNVMDAMAGLLGDRIGCLSTGECELLILAACLHDLGMVYTQEEMARHLTDEQECRAYLQQYAPELLGCPADEWPDDTKQFFLRTLHPFRLPEILQTGTWRELFDECPADVVPKRCIIAVCQAHGEEGASLNNNPNLKHLDASDADPLFCALLLRISDLLDFDDTRAPRILYSYVENNERSRQEWDKHLASAGFTFPKTPSSDPLPYRANCNHAGIEHAVRDFLIWVDDELAVCEGQKSNCRQDWQRRFPFPRSVSRDEIESNGYLSDDFRMTMDQGQILDLLSGENLYNNDAIFVRELLQNSIDAVLLRGRMDPDFFPESSRIDLWEWTDRDGNIWFRIDDEGTGMTLGMLKRYFLKVGNSYYTSKELTRDLHMLGRQASYQGISRFGIGFLSCFLCGKYAEVSTTYFAPEKNRQELGTASPSPSTKYGLRLQITGLKGYYTLRSQEKQHWVDEPMPAPPLEAASVLSQIERDGYRSRPGTSIVVKLDPGKLGAVDLRGMAEQYLFAPKVPVYYNGQRLGKTYQEFMDAIHAVQGETVFELPDEEKAAFDAHFPALAGRYPKISMTVAALDDPKWNILPSLSGALVKYTFIPDGKYSWQVRSLIYDLQHSFQNIDGRDFLCLRPWRVRSMRYNGWFSYSVIYPREALQALDAAFEKLPACPNDPAELGKVWEPFAERENLADMWKAWLDQQQTPLYIDIKKCRIPTRKEFLGNDIYPGVNHIYNGIRHGSVYSIFGYDLTLLMLMENELQPKVNISRKDIVSMPLEAIAAGAVILEAAGFGTDQSLAQAENWTSTPLHIWRSIRTPRMHAWILSLTNMLYERIVHFLREGQVLAYQAFSCTISNDADMQDAEGICITYYYAYLQDNFNMTVSYDDAHTQAVAFTEKEPTSGSGRYDLFPPMLFCRAANDDSRRYLCCADDDYRYAITEDHPYAKWLLDHADTLSRCFPRHFQQIISSLCNRSADDIVEDCEKIREQLGRLAALQGIDLGEIPSLSAADFWSADWMETP